MKARHQRLILIIVALAVLGAVTALVLTALGQGIAAYVTPNDVKNGKIPDAELFRIGGHVKENSIKREQDGVTISFIITDSLADVSVYYKGILPDLFKEGKGAVVQGRLDDKGQLIANEVLAKHDENYMPPEAVQALHEAEEIKKNEAAKSAQDNRQHQLVKPGASLTEHSGNDAGSTGKL